MPHLVTGLSQCYALQKLIFEMVTSEKGVPVQDLPRYIHAWCELEERKRILKGKPLPGEQLRAVTMGLRGDYLAASRPGAKRIRDVPIDVTSCGPDTTTYSGPSENGIGETPQESK